MSFLLFLFVYLCYKFTPSKHRTIFNPCFLFTVLWAVILEMAREQVYGLYKFSFDALIVIIIGVLSWMIGYYLAYLRRKSTLVFQFEKSSTNSRRLIGDYRFNYQVLNIIAVICLIYFFPRFAKSLYMIISGASLETIRSMVQNNSTQLQSGTQLHNLIYNFIILPCTTALETIAVTDFWIGKRNKYLFSLTISIVLVRIVADAGRTPLVNFALYMVIGYLINKKINKNIFQNNLWKSKKNEKTIKKYSFIGLIAILVMSLSRTSSSLIRQVYFYFAMSPVLLTKWMAYTDANGIHTYGFSSITGFAFGFVYFIKNLLRLEYPELISRAYDIIALTDSQWISIAQGNIRANAYVSCFWFGYVDGGYLGVVISMLIYGYIVSKVFFQMYKKLNIRNMALYLLFYQGLFFSFIRLPFAKVYYCFAIIIIYCLTTRKAHTEGV